MTELEAVRQNAVLKTIIAELVNSLEQVLYMPDYDGSPSTSNERLRIKNRAKKLIRQHRGQK